MNTKIDSAPRPVRVCSAPAPRDSGKSYLNFRDRVVDPAELFSEVAYRRLQKVRSQYGPAGVFQSNHPVAPWLIRWAGLRAGRAVARQNTSNGDWQRSPIPVRSDTG